MDRQRRVVIADDHALFRTGLRLLIESDPALAVVASVGESAKAIQALSGGDVDVLLLDVEIDSTSAEVTIRQAARVSPMTAVVILTMHSDGALERLLRSAGASAFLTKDISGPVLLGCLKTQTTGGNAVGRKGFSEPAEPLSDRERQVMMLVAEGWKNREIAGRLCIAEGTVKRHITNIFAKLGARTRTDAVRRMRRLGGIG